MAVSTKSVPVETHWLIGLIKRVHSVLRRVYQIIEKELQSSEIIKEINLQTAVKAVNDTAGSDNLISTLLIFNVYSRMVAADPPALLIS